LILFFKTLADALLSFLKQTFGDKVMNDVAMSGFNKLMVMMAQHFVVIG
jgi:hypothetical protein